MVRFGNRTASSTVRKPYSSAVIARTNKRFSQRWAVIAGQGDDAYLARYTLTRSMAKYYASVHPSNCGPEFTCTECNGARILLSDGGPSGPNGDECARCDGTGVESEPLPYACEEVSLASLPHLDGRRNGLKAVAAKIEEPEPAPPRKRLSGLAD